MGYTSILYGVVITHEVQPTRIRGASVHPSENLQKWELELPITKVSETQLTLDKHSVFGRTILIDVQHSPCHGLTSIANSTTLQSIVRGVPIGGAPLFRQSHNMRSLTYLPPAALCQCQVR
jgi:hypothetical protein